MPPQNLDNYVIRKQGSPIGLIALLIIPLLLIVLVYGFLDPIRLIVIQEMVMQLVHGGVVTTESDTFVENCIDIAGKNERWTVIRSWRKVTYGDGYSLEIYTREPYAPCP
jgi:hypothetical protein